MIILERIVRIKIDKLRIFIVKECFIVKKNETKMMNFYLSDGSVLVSFFIFVDFKDFSGLFFESFVFFEADPYDY
jgi:hypothetical protein